MMSPKVDFRITGIVLAAGLGTRFDPSGKRYKLTMQLADHRPMIVASCSGLLNHVDSLIVVDGERGNELDQALAHPSLSIQRVRCANARLGMGASLKSGI